MGNRENIAVIDLGSANVVVMVGRTTDDGKIHIEELTMNPVEGVLAGEIKNIDAVPKAITEAVGEIERRLGSSISRAVVGISGQHIRCASNSYYVFIGNDGEIKEEDVARLNDSMRNVQAPESNVILHIAPQNYIINDTEESKNPVGMFGNKLQATFNFILGDKRAITLTEKAMSKVGIEIDKLCINAMASAEAVTLPDEKELGVAVVDIGAGTTDVCIYYDNTIRYVGIIPMGADSINKDIRSYGILERYVEEIKVNYGSADSEQESASTVIKVKGRTPRDPKEISFKTLSSIIEARMRDIIEYVMAEIKESGYENRLSSGIVLTGGGADLKGTEALVRRLTGMDVRIGMPDLYMDDDSIELTTDPRLSTAVGLLLSALQSGVEGSVDVTAKPKESKAAVKQSLKDLYADEQSAEQATIPVDDIAAAPASKDEQDEEFFRKEAKKKKKKEGKGWFKKTIDKITTSFDVIDDSSIE